MNDLSRKEEVKNLSRALYHNYCKGDFSAWFSLLHPNSIWICQGEPVLIGGVDIWHNYPDTCALIHQGEKGYQRACYVQKLITYDASPFLNTYGCLLSLTYIQLYPHRTDIPHIHSLLRFLFYDRVCYMGCR